jgi:hypothetical protein
MTTCVVSRFLFCEYFFFPMPVSVDADKCVPEIIKMNDIPPIEIIICVFFILKDF